MNDLILDDPITTSGNGRHETPRVPEVKPFREETRSRLDAYRIEHGLSNADLAAQIGSNASQISRYLGGKPLGDVARLEATAEDVLRAAGRREELRATLFPTNVTQRVNSVCELVRKTADIALIHGPAGCGKSTGIDLYVTANPLAIAITLNRWQFTPLGLQELLWAQIDARAWPGNVRRIAWMIERFRGSDRPLIVDNAHRLQEAGRQWVFDFADATGCPVVLVGNPEVLTPIRKNDQQFSRLGLVKEVTLEKVEDAAAQMLAHLAPEAAEELLPMAIEVARHAGHLRALRKQLTLARELMATSAKLRDPAKAFRAAHTQLIRDYQLADS